MGFWSNFFGWTDASSSITNDSSSCVNPATGLPMLDGCSGIDMGGSPFGTDIHQDWTSSSWDSGRTWDSSSIVGGFGSSWDYPLPTVRYLSGMS